MKITKPENADVGVCVGYFDGQLRLSTTDGRPIAGVVEFSVDASPDSWTVVTAKLILSSPDAAK